MAPNLYTWAPGGRFNILRRLLYCTGIVRCAHTDPDCCCLDPECCCDELFFQDGLDHDLCFDVTGDIVGSGVVHNPGAGSCDFEGRSDNGDWDFSGTGDCSALEFESIELYCPGGGTTPGEYRLNIGTSSICDQVTALAPDSNPACDPVDICFSTSVTCEEYTCSFTICFSECTTSPLALPKSARTKSSIDLNNLIKELPKDVETWLGGWNLK